MSENKNSQNIISWKLIIDKILLSLNVIKIIIVIIFDNLYY